MQFQLIPLIRSLFIETNPIPVKAALALMGKCSGELRLPMTPMAESNLQRLRVALGDFGLLQKSDGTGNYRLWSRRAHGRRGDPRGAAIR